jgi:hypothetical protein
LGHSVQSRAIAMESDATRELTPALRNFLKIIADPRLDGLGVLVVK